MKKFFAALSVLGIVATSVVMANLLTISPATAAGTNVVIGSPVASIGNIGAAVQAAASTAPKVSVTSPTINATVSGTVTVKATATDTGGKTITKVQFKLDGANLGTADTTSPYSVAWNTKTATNGKHVLTAVATNNSSVSTTSSSVTVTVNNPTAPTVSITAPAASATVSGSVTVTATAGGGTAIKNVQFKLDGANLGTADTTSAYSVSWDTKTATNGKHTLTAVATNTASLTTTSSSVSVTVNNPVAPTVSITAPANAATVSGNTTVTATTGGTQAITSVQFKLDGANLGAADTTAPYSVAWNTTTASNGSHALTAVATNSASLSTTSSTVTVTVNNPTAPTVSITAPAASATVSGSTNTVTATAGGTQAITSVQFKLDGVNLGTAVTTAPYSVNWDTTGSVNGSHVLTAVATNSANLTTTSGGVTVTVNNPVIIPPASPNLIPNPSVETAQDVNTPQSWLSSNWGTNTAAFSYLNTGHTGSHSVEAQISAYTNGAANWYYADVPVTAGQAYAYTNWYQSNVDSEVDAEVTMSDGTVQYFYLGAVLANTNWTKFSTTFTVPAGAKSMAVYQNPAMCSTREKTPKSATSSVTTTASTPTRHHPSTAVWSACLSTTVGSINITTLNRCCNN